MGEGSKRRYPEATHKNSPKLQTLFGADIARIVTTLSGSNRMPTVVTKETSFQTFSGFTFKFAVSSVAEIR